MQVRRLTINNFRGIKQAQLLLPKHAVLIGDNNTGKTTVLEALDLVLGPERLNRFPAVDEHDFFAGRYTSSAPVVLAEDSLDAEPSEPASPESDSPQIEIETVVIGLSDEQKAKFGDSVEWWDVSGNELYDEPNPEGVDAENIVPALRVTFIGQYNCDEDDFEGSTYFTRSLTEDEVPSRFGRRDKHVCGFLYLRSLRTGSRALSLERGSLLDIILRLKEVRPQMWEATLDGLASFEVASDEEHGISRVLQSISSALKKYVPKEWGADPHLRVSNLTREHLRKVITAFIATGDGEHAAPFYRQGTGTINMLVLAMLSQIAEDKQNVIFAMEEPETAIPPYAQKRIVQEVRGLASQTLFTSHSPYVLEEFSLNEAVVLSRDTAGEMTQSEIELPPNVKLKRYRQEFRTRFCEGLLASRVLVAEGATEATALPAAARRLEEIDSEKYSSLEVLGICTVDAGGEDNIEGMATLYAALGKLTFAACDQQSAGNEAAIRAVVNTLFMHEEASMEELVVKESAESALLRFADIINWPPHILSQHPDPKSDVKVAFEKYFGWSKGNWGIADFLAQCGEAEMPPWVRDTCAALRLQCDPPSAVGEDEAAADGSLVEDSLSDDEAD